MWIHRGVIALALSACVSAGCAARSNGSFAGRFVKSGTPAVDLGGPALKPAQARSKDATPPPAPRAASLGTSVENTDPRLSAALLVERTVPSPENHLRTALEYKRLGILDMAADHLKLAIKEAPRFAAAHEELARVWRDWGFPQFGLGPAYRAVSFAPRSASAQNTLGTVLAAIGDLDSAERAYQRSLAIEPEAPWVLNNLCDVERRRGRFDQARAHCDAALQKQPTLAAAHNNLALVLASMNDLQGAREQFLAAGDRAGAEYNLGVVYLAKSDYAEAAVCFEEAIRLRPAFTAAKERAHAARLFLLTGGH